MAKKPFNNPFERLKDRARQERAAAKAAPVAPAPDPPGPSSPPGPAPTDADLWARAIAGAKPIDRGPDTVGPRAPRGPPESVYHPDLDAIDALRALVAGDVPFDLSDSDEFVEGRAAGIDVELVRKLRRGEYAVQGHVDLHGLTRGEAKAEVERFLRASRAAGKRCVLVVHGRGMHSKDQIPVLKDALKTWLATNRFGRHVLAFATARPVDGGAGAIYVLLRRQGR